MINFENQKKFTYPFDYLVVDDCFDTSTLNKLLEEWPADKLAEQGRVMGGRRQLSNTGAEQAALGWMGQTAPTWKSFY